MSDWQPIQTAPMDGGTPILAAVRTAYGVKQAVMQFIHWEGGGSSWCIAVLHEPGFMKTVPPFAWQPLPDPPRLSQKGGGE